jgi:hypothetical protein
MAFKAPVRPTGNVAKATLLQSYQPEAQVHIYIQSILNCTYGCEVRCEGDTTILQNLINECPHLIAVAHVRNPSQAASQIASG